MNQTLNSTTETQAQELWATYSQSNENDFWIAYEQLLGQYEAPTTNTAVVTPTVDTTPLFVTQNIYNFYPRIEVILLRVLWIILGVASTLYILDATPSDTANHYILLFFDILLFILLPISLMFRLAMLSVKPSGVYMSKHLLADTDYVLWSNVASVSISKYDNFGGHLLLVKTQDKNYDINYNLSKAAHQLFVSALDQLAIPVTVNNNCDARYTE